MRKSFIALALLVGAVAMWTTLSVAQDISRGDDGYPRLANSARTGPLSRAAKLGVSDVTDTMYIGHSENAPNGGAPFFVGASLTYKPNVNHNGVWDWDTFNGGLCDSIQGFTPAVRPNVRAAGTMADYDRPWWCLDWGNRLAQTPYQGRTPGIISAWHVDGGSLVPDAVNAGASPTWTPLVGNASAWCGLRSGDDLAYQDLAANGGTDNYFNGDALTPDAYGTVVVMRNFPGYANRWDQMLYRDVRVASDGTFSLSFAYATAMSTYLTQTLAAGTGWFDLDPLSMTDGNFISNSNTTGYAQPVDSFMVYVGCPVDPTACQYSDGLTPRAVYDLKRRWFSEVIAIDKPYYELLTVAGDNNTTFSVSLTNEEILPLLEAQAAPDAGGILRVVFRSKTNRVWSDETASAGGAYNSGTAGAVRIDDVSIVGATTITSGFEDPAEINNTVEEGNSDLPGPEVGEGYALAAWHSTGKPPKAYWHTHPIYGGDIGGNNVYEPLVWNDLCGPPDSPLRQCNMYQNIISSGDHDNYEAAGGEVGSPFQENVQWLISPTINLVVPEMPDVNSQGLDESHVFTDQDWYFYYEMYTGIFDIFTQGNVFYTSMISWPANQANGSAVWGDVVLSTYVNYWPIVFCAQTYDNPKAQIWTSNPSGMPDSLRVVICREQRCCSFGLTLGCSPTDGHYVDNVTLALPPTSGQVADNLTVDIWDWYQDAFPANEDDALPGTAAFDTCGALVFTGLNTAAATGDELRFDVPGDTIMIAGVNPEATDMRMDCVFRILPGPGNYTTIGNKGSALRQVPQSTTPAVSGDNSFWGQFLDNDGDFGSNAGAGMTSWDQNHWCSIRCDSLETNLFPCDGRAANLGNLNPDYYQSTIHEDDPHYDALGIVKNRCFLVDTSATPNIDDSNITCSTIPVWLQDPAYADRAGYNPNEIVGQPGMTREYTKIFPDGLLTAGSHIEYFFRYSRIATPATFVMKPDTDRIWPQVGIGPWFDPIRWMDFSVLPDRWKDGAYGGSGAACMLVIDGNDRRGDELIWVSAADSIGATASNKYGAHNGWHCTGAYTSAYWGNSYFWYDTGIGGDPTISVWSHGGQPGTTWDMYQIRGAESATTNAGGIGSRLCNTTDMGLMTGKQSKQGPTPKMLRTYYKLLFFMSGDGNNQVLGPFTNKSQNDVGILEDFLATDADWEAPRGAWFQGNGFMESETGTGGDHLTFLTDYLAASLRDPDYYTFSGSVLAWPDLLPNSTIMGNEDAAWGFANSCTFTNDVLEVNTAVEGAEAAIEYQNLGANGPYVMGVYTPSTVDHPYVTLVGGVDIYNVASREDVNTWGRLSMFMNVLSNAFGSVCAFTPVPVVDAPPLTTRAVDFVGNVWGNPMVAGGKATVHFGLAKADRVEVKVYDVTGRLVRTLANRNFNSGEHTLVWDGTNDQGQGVSRGVYFTQVKFVNSRVLEARKVTVLK